MPLAAFTMAGLLFVYARTSIRLAKQNAQLHREADGELFGLLLPNISFPYIPKSKLKLQDQVGKYPGETKPYDSTARRKQPLQDSSWKDPK
jgi:hypothetical protein